MALVSKTFNELVTFTRSTSATYVNSAGYITSTPVTNYLPYSNQPENAAWTKSAAFVQQNLLTYSQDFDNAGAWGLLNVAAPTPNTTIAPDGTLTADTLTCSAGANVHNIQQVTTLTGTPVTFSVYLKAGTYSFIQIFHGSLLTTYANFNLSTGVLGTVGASFTASITAVANGFYRCTVSFTPTANSAFRIAFISSATAVYNESWTAAGTETVFAWGAQFVQGSVPGDYRATTSAALPVLYPDYTGALRARKLCETTAVTTQHVMFQQVTVGTASSQFTSIVKVKAGERSAVRFINYDGTTNFAFMYVNLTTGAIQSSGVNGTASNATFAVTNLGNGWYLLAITCDIPSANRQSYLNISNPIGTTDYTGDGSSGIYVADAQINPGAVPGPYYDTGTSLTYAQRRDFNPSTLACLGLLVEEQRTNLLIYSQDFDNAAWLLNEATILPNSATAPDGTLTADKFVPSTTPAVTHTIRQAITTTGGAFSIYAKAAGETTFSLWFVAAAQGVLFDLAAGTTTTITGGITSTITNAGNGWYRCTGIFTGATTLVHIYGRNGSGFVGDGVSGIYFWGAQLEAGVYVSSYIPTVASQVTRAADVANVNTLSPWFNQPGGTLYLEADTYQPVDIVVKNAVTVNDGTSNNAHRIISYNGKIGGTTTTAGSTISDLQPFTYTANTPFKFAYAYAVNDFAATGNGGTPLTDTSGALPTGLTTLGIGNVSGVFWGFHIRRITYYPQRLTNAQLQSITT